MAGSDKQRLPPLTSIPVTALGLSPRAQKLLTDSGFQSIAQLLRPTQTQRQALDAWYKPSELREIRLKYGIFVAHIGQLKRYSNAAAGLKARRRVYKLISCPNRRSSLTLSTG